MDPTSLRTKRLYYFTGKHWGLKCLWEKRLKVTRYQELNDPFELAPFELPDARARQFWADQVDRVLTGDQGLLCFSDDWRSPLMWSTYAEKHGGLCLGFDVATDFAMPVEYIEKPLAGMAALRKQLRRSGPEVIEAALRFKQSAWSHEREWRLRVELGEATDGLYFKKFDDDLHLRQVIIGAQCTLSIGDMAEAVVNPPLDVDIIKARASFNSFAVVQHEHVSTHTTKGFKAALALAKDVYHHEMPDAEEEF